MRLLAIVLAGTVGLAGCTSTGTTTAMRTSSDELPNHQLCDQVSCGGSGEAIPVSLIGIGVLFGFALLREALP